MSGKRPGWLAYTCPIWRVSSVRGQNPSPSEHSLKQFRIPPTRIWHTGVDMVSATFFESSCRAEAPASGNVVWDRNLKNRNWIYMWLAVEILI